MPEKKKVKSKAKKSASRKPARKKALRKKTLKKKTATKKKISQKKTAKKKTVKKKAQKKKAASKAKAKRAPGLPSKTTATIEPGPPAGSIPPVEEPAANEEAIGTVTHYYSHLGVAVIQINKGSLKTGDMIHVKGHTTDFTQKVESMEYEHQHINQASASQSLGIKISDHVREHDIVYLVK